MTEICLLTNARRVASVRAETYSNLFSLAVEHFSSVLDQYPVMRRTMESIAAERLNKIGKNPSLVSQREDLQNDLKAVSELLTMSILENDHDSESSHDHDWEVRKGLPRPKSESCFRLSLMTDFTSSLRAPASPLELSSTPVAGTSSVMTASGERHPTTTTRTTLDPQEAAKSSEPVKESKSTFNLHSLLH